jgi:hypothetical protein
MPASACGEQIRQGEQHARRDEGEVDDNTPPQRMRRAALMGILAGAVLVLGAIEVSFG